MSSIRSICVYCGSSPGSRPEYREAAEEVGRALARSGITMVYGGGNVGLMGAAADAALAAGGRVVGVIPEALVAKEVAHRGLTDLLIVASMHDRKLAMAQRADAFIALPGGIGTAEEILESFTWAQLGIQLKPCGLLDTAGFFQGLRMQLERMVEDRFLKAEQLSQLAMHSEVQPLLAQLKAAQPRLVDKWIDRVVTPVQ